MRRREFIILLGSAAATWPFAARTQAGLRRVAVVMYYAQSDQAGQVLLKAFVEIIARPSGNITGFENFQPEIGGKWLGLLKEASPGISRVGILLIPEISAHAAFRQKIEMAAPTLGMQATAIAVHNATEIEHGIATFAEQPNGSLIVLPHPINQQNRDLTIALAARYRLPAIYPFRLY